MKNDMDISPHVLFIHFSVYFLEILVYYPATALWTHKHLPWDPVTNTNISPFLTQQALTPNQMSAGRLTCGQLGVNICLSLDRALCASCIIKCFGRLRGQELSCSQAAEPSHPLCCSFLFSLIHSSMDDVSFLYKNTNYLEEDSMLAAWIRRPWSLLVEGQFANMKSVFTYAMGSAWKSLYLWSCWIDTKYLPCVVSIKRYSPPIEMSFSTCLAFNFRSWKLFTS